MLDEVATAAPLAHFLRVKLAPGNDGVIEARMTGAQGSNLLRTMALASALLHVPQETVRVIAGEMYDAMPLPHALWCPAGDAA